MTKIEGKARSANMICNHYSFERSGTLSSWDREHNMEAKLLKIYAGVAGIRNPVADVIGWWTPSPTTPKHYIFKV